MIDAFKHWILSPTGRPALLLISALLLLRFVAEWLSQGKVKEPDKMRGRRLISYEDAKRRARKLLAKGDPGLCFGGLLLPSSAATSHFAIIGISGSGKSLMVQAMMSSVLPAIRPRADQRALIYDGKQDSMSQLHGMKLSCPIDTLNPFDERGVAWDIARDVTAPATAFEIATILIPSDPNSSQPFFTDAARHLLYGVLLAFMKTAGTEWTLADVMVAVQTQARLKQILELTPETQPLVEQYFGVEERTSDILATLATKLAAINFVAAAWSRTTRRISLREWTTSAGILVLGADESHRAALGAINRVIIKRLSELILAQSESETRRNWIFLDEAKLAGRLDGLDALLVAGRSKGTSVILAFQDLEGLQAVYGREIANELVGQCGHLAVLKLSSPATARFASDAFGTAENKEKHKSETSSRGKLGESSGNTISEQVVKREAVLPAEFLEIAPTGPQNGLTGFFISPRVGAYKATLEWKWLTARLPKPDPNVPNFVPRPEEHQYLKAWTDDDLKRLGLQTPPPAPPPSPPQSRTKSTSKPSGRLGDVKGFGRDR